MLVSVAKLNKNETIMINLEKESKQNSQDNSTEEKIETEKPEGEPSQKNESQEEGQVILTKEEHEKLLKKATDFDGIIEKRRLEKLSKKKQEEENPESQIVVNDEIKKLVADEVARGLTKKNAEDYNANLTEAYKVFIKNNPWADSDEIISAISGSFKADESMTKEQLAAKLESAAQLAYPMEYRKAIEQKVKKEILLDEEKLNVGDSGEMSSVGKGEKKSLTKEQIAFARRCGNDPKEVYSDQAN